MQKTHNKQFTNPLREARRYRNWKVNLTHIAQHNKKIGRNTGQVLYKMKETKLTDYVNLIIFPCDDAILLMQLRYLFQGWTELKTLTLTIPPDDLLTRSSPEITTFRQIDMRTIPSAVNILLPTCYHLLIKLMFVFLS